MGTATLEFLAFALVAAVIYNLSSSLVWRQAVLLVASICFLATFTGSLRAILPFSGFVVLGYACVRVSQHGLGKRAYVAVLILVVGAFVWLKQYAFLPAAIFLRFDYVTVGLSYILFRVLHLVIDAHSSPAVEKIGPVSYLNYALNFMTLVSGPIQRYEDFEKSNKATDRLRMTIISAGEGLHRVVTGFFKVTVLSWIFAGLQKEMLASFGPEQSFEERVFTASVICVSYALYLFFNFSGYMDIVIGIGKYFGFALPENFDRPLSAANYMSLWSRWHITLSDWLKTYVYNPMLMACMRRWPAPQWEPFFVVGSLFITFFIVGVWHGRTSEFFVFGVLQGFGIAANRFYQIWIAKKLGQKKYRALSSNPVYVMLCRGLTFTYFTFSLLWFWSSWKQMGDMVGKLHWTGILAALLLIYFVATLLLALLESVRERVLSIQWEGRPFLLSRYCLTVLDTSLAVCSLAVGMLLKAPPPEIVYKAF